MKYQDINNNHIMPGHMLSADHYILWATGRLYHTQKGKSDPSDMYSGGCVLIEHASGYIRIKHQVAINATETVKAKITFEREDKSQGVMINVYNTDNLIFNNSKFMEELLKKQKKIRFSGARASHQNGAAERGIKTAVTMESAICMQAWMICHKDTLFIDFCQRKWTMLYGYKVESLI